MWQPLNNRFFYYILFTLQIEESELNYSFCLGIICFAFKTYLIFNTIFLISCNFKHVNNSHQKNTPEVIKFNTLKQERRYLCFEKKISSKMYAQIPPPFLSEIQNTYFDILISVL